MKDNPNIISKLRAHGERITPIRTALIGILSKSHKPQTPLALIAALLKSGLRVNKTTVYRQLETLERYAIVRAVRFADSVNRYELQGEGGHHHHLVCLTCGRITDVDFPTDLDRQEKIIQKKHHFKVLRHSLEFFGICRACARKQS